MQSQKNHLFNMDCTTELDETRWIYFVRILLRVKNIADETVQNRRCLQLVSPFGLSCFSAFHHYM